jgi:hypothetical protein
MAIGGSSISCSSVLPLKVRRDSATDAMVPSTVAITAVITAMTTLLTPAEISWSLPDSATYHFKVKWKGSW